MTTDERIKDIRENPDRHRHRTFDQLVSCSTENGAVNLAVFQAHETYAPHGTNGGTNCDVSSGPCSCGAWH